MNPFRKITQWLFGTEPSYDATLLATAMTYGVKALGKKAPSPSYDAHVRVWENIQRGAREPRPQPAPPAQTLDATDRWIVKSQPRPPDPK